MADVTIPTDGQVLGVDLVELPAPALDAEGRQDALPGGGDAA